MERNGKNNLKKYEHAQQPGLGVVFGERTFFNIKRCALSLNCIIKRGKHKKSNFLSNVGFLSNYHTINILSRQRYVSKHFFML